MSDGATKVRYAPIHKSLDFGNYGLAGKLARTARKQGIADAKAKIAAHVPKNLFYRAANPFLEKINLTGLTRYKTRRMSRMRYLFETKALGSLSNISAASMIEANAVRGQGEYEEVVGGGCHVKGRRESVGVVQKHLGNPMGRINDQRLQSQSVSTMDGNEIQSTYTEAANINAAPTTQSAPRQEEQEKKAPLPVPANLTTAPRELAA